MSSDGIDRRDALKLIAAAGGLTAAASSAEAQNPAPAQATPPARTLPLAGPRGTPTDPDLLRPRADWPRKLSAGELATLAVLCDTIIPADAKSPGAAAAGVPAYINEYVSAPYDGQMRDLIRVRGGLAWLNVESGKRFGKPFARLSAAERAQICDDICYLPKAKPEFQAAARFFDLVRDLTAVGFYTTEAGMKDLQYVGNVALPRFDGPPPAVLKHLGLA
ncbi:MAG: gluconate 2-dehydrogenase subunit 3 family protein [Gemmatimonadales bacterium]|nr:gluconate 2-dehydrogenase subunit 3 family protein [Gemmatimonadales bacterium]